MEKLWNRIGWASEGTHYSYSLLSSSILKRISVCECGLKMNLARVPQMMRLLLTKRTHVLPCFSTPIVMIYMNLNFKHYAQ